MVMESSSKSIVSGTMIYAICNIFVSGLAVITSPIFTRLMSVSDYGIYSLFNSWNNIVFCVSSFGLSYAIAPAIRKYKSELGAFTICMTAFSCILPAVLLIGCLFGLDRFFSYAFMLPKSTIILLWGEMILYSIIMFENEKLMIGGKFKKYAILSIIRALGSTLLAILLILIEQENTYNGRIIGLIGTSLIICLYIFWSNRKSVSQITSSIEYLRFALPIALPMIFHGLAMVILGQVDRIMISRYFSEIETGLYSYGYSIGTMIMFILNASASAIQPVFYKKFGKDDFGLVKILKKNAEMMFFASVIFALIAPEIVKVLADSKYWGTVTFIYPLISGCYCQYLYTFYCKVEIIEKRTSYIAVGSALAAVINFFLNAIFLPKFGYQIAAITTFIGYFVLLIFHMLISKNICKVDAFGYGKNILYASLLFMVMLGVSLVVDSISIRYAALLIVGFIFIRHL